MMKAEKAAMLRETLLNTKVEKIDVNVSLVKEIQTSTEKKNEIQIPTPNPWHPHISLDFELRFPQPIETYKLSCPVDSIYYIPDCVDEEASRRILALINSTDNSAGQIEPVAETLSLWRTLGSEWTQLKARKLQQWGRMIRGPEDSGAGAATGQATETENALPAWLQSLSQELVRGGIFSAQEAPNHVLVNDYKPQGGILHHTDGPFYRPNVAILSLGGPMLLTFRKRLSTEQIAARDSSSQSTAAGVVDGGDRRGQSAINQDLYSVLLQSNSLLVFREALYSDYLHGIADGSFFETIDADALPEGAGTGEEQAALRCMCMCLNKSEAGVLPGQRVERMRRTSLTFRRTQ